ncbi:hypothetical protein SOVF_064100 [Spinacia oleracea]|nr:hypothetical protein SOVF_064100 [Spinacia oleracea]
MENGSPKMDEDYMKSAPPWKSNDLKFEWKMPFGNASIKKWVKEMKEKRKEGKRLQRAEVHAALSIAGLATALAAIAEESSKGQLEYESCPARRAALASAAAVVASQCAQVAESIGAKKDQLSSIIGSAMNGTTTNDIFTLTAAATTSLRGAATLKARSGYKSRLNGEPVLPIDVDNCKLDDDLDFVKSRTTLSKGAELTIETANGVVLDLHAELYKDEGGEEFDTCYQVVLTTTRGPIKIDMADDYQRYKMWATTISRMLKMPSTLAKYQLQFCKY